MMQTSEWAMLIFAAVGLAQGWLYAADRFGDRDRLGVRGRPGAALACLAMAGAFGAAIFTREESSFVTFLFWCCLTTGAQVLGFLAAIAGAEVRDYLR